MIRPIWTLVTAAATAVVALSAASPAAADTYTVFSCKGPTGTPNGAAGWAATPAPSGVGQAVSSCPAGGPLSAFIDVDPSGTASASWTFAAPADTRIVRFAATRRTTGIGQDPAPQPNDVQYILSTDQVTLESCAVSDTSSCVADLTDPIDKQGLDAGLVRFRVLCTNTGLSCPRPLRADFDSMQVGLKDVAAPAVSAVNVIDDGLNSGVLTVAFNASDLGGGVYRAVVSVDGKPAIAQALGDANCADANPADGDLYQFVLPVPCPAAVNAAVVKVDYRQLTAGPHGVEIAVEDAAGNSTSVFGPIQFPRVNIEVLPGTPAGLQRVLRGRLRVWFDRNRRKRFTSVYGERVVVRGVLRDPRGRGIQGSRIDVYHLRRNGTRRLVKTGLKTRPHGALTIILPLNLDTRRIEFDFRALRPGPVTSRQVLRLTVMRHGRMFVRKPR